MHEIDLSAIADVWAMSADQIDRNCAQCGHTWSKAALAKHQANARTGREVVAELRKPITNEQALAVLSRACRAIKERG